jgi:hypothetical protein
MSEASDDRFELVMRAAALRGLTLNIKPGAVLYLICTGAIEPLTADELATAAQKPPARTPPSVNDLA